MKTKNTLKMVSLRVRKRYFDAIVSEDKSVEYRKNSSFWQKRLLGMSAEQYRLLMGVADAEFPFKEVLEEPMVAVFICGKQIHRRPIVAIERLKTPTWFSEQGKSDVDTDTCFALYLQKAPEGATIFGKCPGPFCEGEYAWLFPSDCDRKPWCEGCIAEAHDRAQDAWDFGEDLPPEELAEMEETEEWCGDELW